MIRAARSARPGFHDRVLALAAVLALGPGALAVPLAALAAYPDRPITMIVAFVPGGGTDIVARALVPYLEKQLGSGARVVVLNRGGAGGEIGFTAIANAAPDGYTIGFINSPATQA